MHKLKAHRLRVGWMQHLGLYARANTLECSIRGSCPTKRHSKVRLWRVAQSGMPDVYAEGTPGRDREGGGATCWWPPLVGAGVVQPIVAASPSSESAGQSNAGCSASKAIVIDRKAACWLGSKLTGGRCPRNAPPPMDSRQHITVPVNNCERAKHALWLAACGLWVPGLAPWICWPSTSSQLSADYNLPSSSAIQHSSLRGQRPVMAPSTTAPHADGDGSNGPPAKSRIVMLYEEYIHLPMLQKVGQALCCRRPCTLGPLPCAPQSHWKVSWLKHAGC